MPTGILFGGAEGDRTPDLMTASHALSQLSYGPRAANNARAMIEEKATGYQIGVARASRR
jgi:hypothetical protein